MKNEKRQTVKEMYRDYQSWKPVRVIARDNGLTPSGVYWLFERENLVRDMKRKARGE